MIAFVGSVFSPYYAWARRNAPADPLNHCAFNIALYGRGARWAMTERNAAQVHREPTVLRIGPSHMHWTGEALEIRIDEVCAPLPRRLRGTIRLLPRAIFDRCFMLDEAGRHRWTPFAPCARIEVLLSEPALKWSGLGYFDSNSGDEPLEDGFTDWTWSRTGVRDATRVFYDVNPRTTPSRSLALEFTAHQSLEAIEPPPQTALPPTSWRVARSTRADTGCPTHILANLENAPFYSRTLIDSSVHGARAPAIHESVDLERFRAAWVKCLLPFRMPRAL